MERSHFEDFLLPILLAPASPQHIIRILEALDEVKYPWNNTVSKLKEPLFHAIIQRLTTKSGKPSTQFVESFQIPLIELLKKHGFLWHDLSMEVRMAFYESFEKCSGMYSFVATGRLFFL
jgi:hypothetical protein